MKRNYRRIGTIGAVAAVAVTWTVLTAPPADADDGWVAVANSPNHEQQDWGWPDQATAELNALTQCTMLQRASDCRVLSVSTDLVVT